MILRSSLYCHENTLDVEIYKNIYKFIQSQVINKTSVAMTMYNPWLPWSLENLQYTITKTYNLWL